MSKDFSSAWSGSVSPSKQRKYRLNAPLHVKHRMLSTHLSKELRKQYKTRNLPVRKGDLVLIMRGKFRGQEGHVEKVYSKQLKVAVDIAKNVTKKGNKVPLKLRPSALLIKELNVSDKMRNQKLDAYGKTR